MTNDKAVCAVRKALERNYRGHMVVYAAEKYKVGGETRTRWKPLAVAPCYLSRGEASASAQGEDAARIRYIAKVLCAPELVIAAGCRVTVEQDGVACAFLHAGEAPRYPTHQEIPVERWEAV